LLRDFVESYNAVARCQQMGSRWAGQIITRQRLQCSQRYQGM